MLTIKYNKINQAKFISHIDLLRVHIRTLRRAGIEVEFSKGFNPHMLINMSTPMPTGLASTCEYLTVATKMDKDEFLTRYNACCIPSMKAECVFMTSVNPNVAGKGFYSEYLYVDESICNSKELLNNILHLDNYEITYIQKGEKITKDIRGLIKDITFQSDGVHFVLCSGNANLRIDRLLEHLCQKVGCIFYPSKITRVKQLTEVDGQIISLDEYLKRLV